MPRPTREFRAVTRVVDLLLTEDAKIPPLTNDFLVRVVQTIEKMSYLLPPETGKLLLRKFIDRNERSPRRDITKLIEVFEGYGDHFVDRLSGVIGHNESPRGILDAPPQGSIPGALLARFLAHFLEDDGDNFVFTDNFLLRVLLAIDTEIGELKRDHVNDILLEIKSLRVSRGEAGVRPPEDDDIPALELAKKQLKDIELGENGWGETRMTRLY